VALAVWAVAEQGLQVLERNQRAATEFFTSSIKRIKQ
jgi:hypothetical protein